VLGEEGGDEIQRLSVMGKPIPYDLQNGERNMHGVEQLKAVEMRCAPRPAMSAILVSAIIGSILVHGLSHDGSVAPWL
jgi:hypothetical protein